MAGAASSIGVEEINRLTGGRHGQFDVPCPLCGPQRRSPVNRRRKVLRVWRIDPSFAGFHCARCGEKGHARDRNAPSPDPVKFAEVRAEAAERERVAMGERLSKARGLWSCRLPIAGTAAATYLRDVRGYRGPMPGTLGFLPGGGNFPPAMIAAFGIPGETEPGVLQIPDDAVRGVQLTRLKPDGTGKAGTETDKTMIGLSHGWPIVLAPCNDLLGLVIAEGIEDSLSAHAATGLGSWAAGGAARLALLADVIPPYVESLTILVDDDPDGLRWSGEFAAKVKDRIPEVRLIMPGAVSRAAT
jgi:hypothetical protein